MLNEPIPPEDARHSATVYESLTQSLRELIDVTIRSDAAEADVGRAHALIEEAAGLLGARQGFNTGSLPSTGDGRYRPWGNVATGLRNALAPPLRLQRDDTGRMATDLVLGAAYEGPPGQVHGGMCALVLDHLLGATAHRPGQPAFTGTLTLRYVAPTPLGKLRAESWVEREDSRKTFTEGHLVDPQGRVTVHAAGIFIRPKPKA